MSVRGVAGELLLVFGADGRVAANVASPDWWAHARASTSTPLPDVEADATAEPVLREQSSAGALGWLVPAAAYPDEEPPDVDTGRVVLDWTLDVEVAGERVEVPGRTAWVPDGVDPATVFAGGGAGEGGAAGGPGVADLLAALAGIAAVAALIVVRRARSRRVAGSDGRARGGDAG